jgi:hypothetical protein
MADVSAFDSNFLSTVKQWLEEYHDTFVVARYSAMAGAKEYFWFKTWHAFRTQLDHFPPQTHVSVFRDNQFPLRGIVNPEFIRQTLIFIPDHSEAMVTSGLEPSDEAVSLWGPDTHAEMLDTLQDLVGEPVSVGFYAPWHKLDSETMISALIPLSDGTIRRGAY